MLDNRAKSRMKDGNRCKIKMQNPQNANNIDDMPYFCKLDFDWHENGNFSPVLSIEVVENILLWTKESQKIGLNRICMLRCQQNFFSKYPSLNTQSCFRGPLCTCKNTPQKWLIISPKCFFSVLPGCPNSPKTEILYHQKTLI